LTGTDEEIIIVFKSTHETLSAEKELKGAGIRIRTMVKPRSISSNCALALSFRRDDRWKVRRLCEEKGRRPVGFYVSAVDGSWIEVGPD
jgi:hypothetical protein